MELNWEVTQLWKHLYLVLLSPAGQISPGILTISHCPAVLLYNSSKMVNSSYYLAILGLIWLGDMFVR